MSTKNPEIRIYYSYLLRENVSERFAKEYKAKLLDTETYEEFTQNYIKSWRPLEKKILSAMCEVVDLEFYKTVIDVPLAPYVMGQSTPLILNYVYYPNEFIGLLTHELSHVLLTDNQKYSFHYDKNIDLLDLWGQMYGTKKDFKELTHIPVHAMLKHIYLDTLGEPGRLTKDIEQCQKWPGYKEAWEYVENHDYKNILTDLKAMYERISTEGNT